MSNPQPPSSSARRALPTDWIFIIGLIAIIIGSLIAWATSGEGETISPEPSSVAPVAEYSVGDVGPGGGYIFYVDLARPLGSQYFELACAGWMNSCDGYPDPILPWGCEGKTIPGTNNTGYASEVIGMGEGNTALIIAGCPTPNIAAAAAGDYMNNGLDDWFLPSKDELNAMCKWAVNDTVNAICNDEGLDSFSLTYGGFSKSIYYLGITYKYYLSSSTYLSGRWIQEFEGLYPSQINPSSGSTEFIIEGAVRPVRTF